MSKYRGQWGGKIESGEEMWWSEPDPGLRRGRWHARLRFALDVRQHFILKFFRTASRGWGGRPVLVDYGCGTGGTTLNFSSYLGQPITGYDVFETQLEIGRRFAAEGKSGCRFEMLSADGSIPLDSGSVDAIFSLDVLGHVPSIPAVLAHWRKALRPGTGAVLLFTEGHYGEADRSLMASFARRGVADLCAAVPEHVSLFPRETLERMFDEAGLEVEERYSANVWHFLFFPKDYVLALRGKTRARGWYALAWSWNRISRLFPFYPAPFNLLRLAVTRLLGARAHGTAYFYRLRARE